MSCFITFEGVEGCGKTTQIRLLAEKLAGLGKKTILTREPGGCPIADKIRAILLDAANSAMVPKAELLLYGAARAQHLEEVIKPALADGAILLCDRFTDATLAYQGFGRGLDLDFIRELNDAATGGRYPDLTILVDCPAETGIGRAIARIEAGSAANSNHLREERFELESIEFHRRVRSGYLHLAEQEPGRFIVVDGNRPIEKVAEDIFITVAKKVGL